MEKYDVNQPVVLKRGVYQLNDEANFNYQLNRVINWDGGEGSVGSISSVLLVIWCYFLSKLSKILFILFKFIDYFLIKIMFHARKCSKQAACSKKLAVHKLFL